eukprot:scaffold94636_cov60-Phaeocystis_antarctica.AAC.2
MNASHEQTYSASELTPFTSKVLLGNALGFHICIARRHQLFVLGAARRIVRRGSGARRWRQPALREEEDLVVGPQCRGWHMVLLRVAVGAPWDLLFGYERRHRDHNHLDQALGAAVAGN